MQVGNPANAKSIVVCTPNWVPNESRTHCKCCAKKFHTLRRKHHCRACGEVICRKCSNARLYVRIQVDPVRVCKDCNSENADKKNVVSNKIAPVIERVTELKTPSKLKQLTAPPSKKSPYQDLVPVFLVCGVVCAKYVLPTEVLLCALMIKGTLWFYIWRTIKGKSGAHSREVTVLSSAVTNESDEASSKKYIEALKNAFDMALNALACKNGEDGWHFDSRQFDIDIFLKKEKNLTFVRGEGIIPVKKELVADLLNDPTRTGEYDTKLKSLSQVEILDGRLLRKDGENPSVCIIYTQLHRVFPTTARDACIVRGRVIEPDGRIIAVSTSVEHPKAPLHKDYVRANVICSGTVLEDAPGNPDHTMMKYVMMLDPTGSIPSFVVEKTAPERALLIHRVRNCFVN